LQASLSSNLISNLLHLGDAKSHWPTQYPAQEILLRFATTNIISDIRRFVKGDSRIFLIAGIRQPYNFAGIANAPLRAKDLPSLVRAFAGPAEGEQV
jgi:hypothetical protein